ncbi:HAMP domain-containing sensor histidine kinase [uncultured Sphingomonas sp.]|uniref:sensor histidine kinase n=1 Tax=uncultured Sphingomonas sp. TaxID=158754 RepID=UPI0025CFE098|nr:HAMP domain-containing sensor histidine kinase [uncultured Sphingomonas sp.]
MALSTTARLGLMTVALALVAGWVPVGFLWHSTHNDAIETLRRDTLERSRILSAAIGRDGRRALDDAVAQTHLPGDASLIVAMVDDEGRRLSGVGPLQLSSVPTPGFRIAHIGTNPPWNTREAGVEITRNGTAWLVTGRLLDDWETAQRGIERALALSALVSLVLGVAGAAVLMRSITRRIDGVATTADAVAGGDLARRVALPAAGHDAFDRLGLRVNAMLDRIERLMEELRIVTDSLAHDLRSPVARLRAKAEAALLAPDDAQREAALGGLIGEADVLGRMLAVLLEISRFEATARRTGFTTAEPAEIAAALAELYEPVLEDAGIAFTADIAPVAPVELHRELLSQAIANLIDNAVRHAPDGGSITLSVTDSPDGVHIAVGDRGPGIAPADREAALRRFGRLDPARSKPGAGLGLTLVAAVAKMHGGRLELGDNAPGLRATVILPRS